MPLTGEILFRRRIREYETDRIAPLLPERSTLLEIGAGDGWQARKLSEHNIAVTAIDIKEGHHTGEPVWRIVRYDGKRIPFADNRFDIVFTSNVLDHVTGLEEFTREIRRVLKPDGIAVHSVPTATWRLWTSLSHYPNQLKQLFFLIINAILPKRHPWRRPEVRLAANTPNGHVKGFLTTVLLPPRLGVRGNLFGDLYLFSRFHRLAFFRKNGWVVRKCLPNKLFYTGNKLFGAGLTIKARRAMSRVLGSSCLTYVMEKAPRFRN